LRLGIAAQNEKQLGWGVPLSFPCEGTDQTVTLVFKVKGPGAWVQLPAESVADCIVLQGKPLSRDIHLRRGKPASLVGSLIALNLKPDSSVDEIRAVFHTIVIRPEAQA
jgi:hypothetical protein